MPTCVYNKTSANFAKNDKRIFNVIRYASNQEDEMNQLLDYCEKLFTGRNTLLILDDCAISQDLRKRSNIFIDLTSSGSHYDYHYGFLLNN